MKGSNSTASSHFTLEVPESEHGLNLMSESTRMMTSSYMLLTVALNNETGQNKRKTSQ